VTLQYAPPAKSPNRFAWVILDGLATTAVALVGVHVLAVEADTNIMGWYANYVIPAGAILVGLVASSGYGAASYLSGVKIARSLLVTILLLQVAAYFAAEYLDFSSLGPMVHQDTGRPVGFFEYFDFKARSFAWKNKTGGGSGEALGLGGYFFVGLGLVGFAAGSLIVPGVLMNKPYCGLCQLYMKQRRLAVVGADVPARKLKKKDDAGHAALAADQQRAADEADRTVGTLTQMAKAGDVAGLRAGLAVLGRDGKRAEKLPRRVRLTLVHCRGCGTGHLQPTFAAGQGKQMQLTPLAQTELSREVVAALSEGK
jgi:hypothetical protein